MNKFQRVATIALIMQAICVVFSFIYPTAYQFSLLCMMFAFIVFLSVLGSVYYTYREYNKLLYRIKAGIQEEINKTAVRLNRKSLKKRGRITK